MLQRDYLVQMLTMFAQAIARSLERRKTKNDPLGAAEMLEAAISEATDIDGDILLQLAPESVASILQVSSVDPRVAGYIVRSMYLESEYLAEAGDMGLSQLRFQQADAIADAYGFAEEDIPPADEQAPIDVLDE